jgi:hypothetical protein
VKALAAAVVLVASLALTACDNKDCPQPESLGAVTPVAMSVPMPRRAPAPPPPAPRPQRPAFAPKAPVFRAPAPPKAPAPPRVRAPRQQAPRLYAPPPSIARPVRRPAVYDYRQVYIQHRTDHTPLLWLMVMNGAFDSPQPVTERCEQ